MYGARACAPRRAARSKEITIGIERESVEALILVWDVI